MFNNEFYQLGKKSIYINSQHDIDEIISYWNNIKFKMIHSRPEEFTRTEWAYLINFISSSNLNSYIKECFGEKVNKDYTPPLYIYNPYNKIALWLPNNVSLLGPLSLILISLIGPEIKVKTGSTGKNLLSPFLNWVKTNSNDDELINWINEKVHLYSFNRESDQNLSFANWADVRILFGSNSAADAIEKYPHPTHSTALYFTDRSSEIWIDTKDASATILSDICKIIQIYGQKGCTSPKRICLLNASLQDATILGEKILEVWKQLNFPKSEQIFASEVFLNNQISKEKEYTSLTSENLVNITITPASNSIITGQLQINLQYGDFQDFVNTLPSNIQTIGAHLTRQTLDQLVKESSIQRISRIVPISEMHNFDIHWDSISWWQSLFKETKVNYDCY